MATEAEAKIGHTPPPWREGVEGNNRVYGPDGCGADSGLVAVVYKGRANVSLVSAAPDLLVALHEAVLALDGLAKGEGVFKPIEQTVVLARTAIAKAEGRS